MESKFGPKQIIISFLIVLGCYMGIFHWIEHRRQVKGPWEVSFAQTKEGVPQVEIRQPGLDIQSVVLLFPGESIESSTNIPRTVSFDKPGKITPFGQVIYEDLTFLPGVVTFNLFGHEIELIPKTLVINRKDTSWKPSLRLEVDPASKPVSPPKPPPGGTRDTEK